MACRLSCQWSLILPLFRKRHTHTHTNKGEIQKHKSTCCALPHTDMHRSFRQTNMDAHSTQDTCMHTQPHAIFFQFTHTNNNTHRHTQTHTLTQVFYTHSKCSLDIVNPLKHSHRVQTQDTQMIHGQLYPQALPFIICPALSLYTTILQQFLSSY